MLKCVLYRLSDYKYSAGNERNKVEFAVKFKTERLVDLEINTPSKMMRMEDVSFKTDGFIPRGSLNYNTLMRMMSIAARKYMAMHMDT